MMQMTRGLLINAAAVLASAIIGYYVFDLLPI